MVRVGGIPVGLAVKRFEFETGERSSRDNDGFDAGDLDLPGGGGMTLIDEGKLTLVARCQGKNRRTNWKNSSLSNTGPSSATFLSPGLLGRFDLGMVRVGTRYPQQASPFRCGCGSARSFRPGPRPGCGCDSGQPNYRRPSGARYSARWSVAALTAYTNVPTALPAALTSSCISSPSCHGAGCKTI